MCVGNIYLGRRFSPIEKDMIAKGDYTFLHVIKGMFSYSDAMKRNEQARMEAYEKLFMGDAWESPSKE